ncbi:hypothetical protein M5689_024341 [Euphorbia peplus]|nr:hypothetical protein M5689_024341 [Euphorbia peplus]
MVGQRLQPQHILENVKTVMQITVSNYWEAIGVVAAHKAGIDPCSLRRDRIGKIQRNAFVPTALQFQVSHKLRELGRLSYTYKHIINIGESWLAEDRVKKE